MAAAERAESFDGVESDVARDSDKRDGFAAAADDDEVDDNDARDAVDMLSRFSRVLQSALSSSANNAMNLRKVDEFRAATQTHKVTRQKSLTSERCLQHPAKMRLRN
jgi:hypothetical protein